jgi:hypothetical protein
VDRDYRLIIGRGASANGVATVAGGGAPEPKPPAAQWLFKPVLEEALLGFRSRQARFLARRVRRG